MLFGFVTGRTRIKIEGAMPLSFVGEIRKRMAVRNIVSDGFSCDFTVRMKNEKNVCEGAKKRGLSATVIKNSGLFFHVKRLCARRGLVLGGIIFVLLVYLSSLFVWDIRIVGNSNVSSDEIIKGLSEAGLRKGVMKSSIDVEDVRNRYIISDKRVSWMSVILYGTTANVEVIESTIPPPREDKAPLCNIVACRDGIIERVDALMGQSTVEKGQVVSKGELLVSAVIKTRKENELLTGAKGNVFAKTERHFEVHVPLYEYKKQYSEKEHTKYSLLVAGHEFALPYFEKNKSEALKECEKSVTRPVVFGKIEMPFETVKRKYRCYDVIKTQRKEEECKKIAEAKLSSLVEKSVGSAPVVNKEIDFNVYDEKIVLVCDMECIENIAQKVPITFSV